MKNKIYIIDGKTYLNHINDEVLRCRDEHVHENITSHGPCVISGECLTDALPQRLLAPNNV